MTQAPSMTFDDRDEFGRKKIAERIITLLNSDITVSPLVLDGSWGLGKTEFCQKLISLMKKDDTHHLVYIDAFKADHADEPLLTVLAKVIEVLPEDKKKEKLIEKALPALRYGLKVGGKALVAHVLRQDTDSIFDDFDQEVKAAADKAIDESVESLLNDHVEADKNLRTLQSALKSVAAEKPIVLFVDELDRCRPDFAVLMLETIKHTFDVEGVQFVLVTNTDQLKASINHCYGSAIDAKRYIDKFVKFSLSLPHTYDNRQHNAEVSAVTHYKNLLEKSDILCELKLDKYAHFWLAERVINENSISLREVETLIRHLEIYQILYGHEPLSNQEQWMVKLMRVLGAMMVCFKPNMAKNTVSDSLDALELATFMGVTGPLSFGNRRAPTHPEMLMFMLAQSCKYNGEKFKPSRDQRVRWDNEEQGYFQG
ncbi:AAA family ATPase, partial [Salinivibrio sp. VYel6]|uniref:KAP family NTPase n=1 Tax=Salinivibrio sp. VYel6 TaxID=2490493 RepID=UPI00128D36EB